jgi:hypothetical protein
VHRLLDRRCRRDVASSEARWASRRWPWSSRTPIGKCCGFCAATTLPSSAFRSPSARAFRSAPGGRPRLASPGGSSLDRDLGHPGHGGRTNDAERRKLCARVAADRSSSRAQQEEAPRLESTTAKCWRRVASSGPGCRVERDRGLPHPRECAPGGWQSSWPQA